MEPQLYLHVNIYYNACIVKDYKWNELHSNVASYMSFTKKLADLYSPESTDLVSYLVCNKLVKTITWITH